MWQELNINACIHSSVILSIYTLFFGLKHTTKREIKHQHLVRLAGGWWLMLICCERKILVAAGWC
jgi:Na+/proline symporter